MKSLRISIIFSLLSLAVSFTACEKSLEEPSNKTLKVISSLEDLQALLDNYSLMNYNGANAQEYSADDYCLEDADWESLMYEESKRMYLWQRDYIFRIGSNGNDWLNLYRPVYYANTVLEGLDKLSAKDKASTSAAYLRGQALVFRAVSFLDAVQIWAPAYDPATASTDVGIPLKLESDFNIHTKRSSVAESYERIITDLKSSLPLLPSLPITPLRPSRAAAYALLARTYLWMRNYDQALLYADSCLQLKSQLMNYNNLRSADTYPIKKHNEEIIFERGSALGDLLAVGRAKIDKQLYSSYDANDLRKSIFFQTTADGSAEFRGFYIGSQIVYTGLTSNEILLTRAECLARRGNVKEAIEDLNRLLENRWITGKFERQNVSNKNEALQLILTERRKELLMHGLRWMDIKRLNMEGANINLERKIKGNVYSLKANSEGFTLPLPDDILSYYQ